MHSRHFPRRSQRQILEVFASNGSSPVPYLTWTALDDCTDGFGIAAAGGRHEIHNLLNVRNGAEKLLDRQRWLITVGPSASPIVCHENVVGKDGRDHAT